MAKVIIGIHGLSNKPVETQLYEWWLRAINDGLSKFTDQSLSAAQFKLAYWADLMNRTPDTNPEPYTEPGTDEDDDDSSELADMARGFLSEGIGKFGDLKVQMTDSERIEGIKNAVREKVVKDLAEYYEDSSSIKFTNRAGTQTRTALRDVLHNLIVQHQADHLLVIGHSMGSIIAYDVLRSLRGTAMKVDHLVTIGSPLGLANVKAKAREYWDDKGAPFVPEVLTRGWANFSDRKDLVCIDPTLTREYKPSNSIGVEDAFVTNGYRHRKNNHHKSYGYLRTQPVAEYLRDFLAE